MFFALFKLLPLFEPYLGILALAGGTTFLFSNLVGLRQANVQRMLGYSSIAQMGLLVLALSLLHEVDAEAALPLVVGGLFVNHLFAKAGLFWLAGVVGRDEVDDWAGIAGNRLVLMTLAALVVAIAGLPPFPAFWAKWELVMQAAAGGRHVAIAVVLIGSLLEAAYMFRWLGQAKRAMPGEAVVVLPVVRLMPAMACVVLLAASGTMAASLADAASLLLVAPLYIGAGLFLFDGLPGRVKCLLMLIAVSASGVAILRDIQGINQLFGVVLLCGGLIIGFAGLYRSEPRSGFHAMLAVLLLSIVALLGASTRLEFFFHWEIITLSSYFLIAQGRRAGSHILPFLLFSLASAYCMLAGFALLAVANGTTALASLATAGPAATTAFTLLAIGFLVKTGAVGVHVWLPGAYVEADDDLSAMLSAVISKVAVFGLFMVTYLAIRSEVGLDVAHAMGWIGLLTTLAGAVLALQQSDMKRMLAYSSMSQIGYIVTAIALMSHLGWVTAFYLVANHLMVKGILFLAVAAVILRTGTRLLDQTGGVAAKMPFTFGLVVIALVSMSGLPPLAGFGGKWLLLSAMVDRGWYGLAILTVLATFIGFLYMFRLAHALSVGSGKADRGDLHEAPWPLLGAQFVLAAAIFLLSFYPKLFMDPVSAAIDPYFASTLVWQGMSLETIYGYWNPIPVMAMTVAATAVLFLLFLLVYRRRGGRTPAMGTPHFYGFYQTALARLVVPIASVFWDGVCAATMAAAGGVRKIYTGNGQTYALHVLYYVIVLYVLGTFGFPRG